MKEKGKKNLLETNVTSHGSVKKLRSSSERKCFGHIITILHRQLNRLRSLRQVGIGEGRGGASEEKSACELHFVVY